MWAKIDDGFFRHPKARAVGKDGRALFVAGLCWSAAQLSDGFIAKPELGLIAAEAEVNATRTARLLVENGLWETAHGGWHIHDYHLFNPSAEDVRERRKKRAEAGRIGGLRSKPPGSKPEATSEANGEAGASENGPKPEAKPKPNRTPSPSPYPLSESFTANPMLKGQPPAPADDLIGLAAAIVADRETTRRAGELKNPSGYRHSRIEPLRQQHAAFWMGVLDVEPMSTPEQLADALERRTAALTPRATAACGVCGTENPINCGDDCPIKPSPAAAKVIDLMANLERSVAEAKKARPTKDPA